MTTGNGPAPKGQILGIDFLDTYHMLYIIYASVHQNVQAHFCMWLLMKQILYYLQVGLLDAIKMNLDFQNHRSWISMPTSCAYIIFDFLFNT